VEDSDDDADLMEKELRDSALNVDVSWVQDGEAAMRFLRRESPYEASPRPDLILLDVHLPRMNGLEVLKEMDRYPDLRSIPVVIMTSSNSEKTFLEAYDLHANCCVSKPVDQDEYSLAVKKIERFWLHVARRPRPQ
jgi:CheY-like chemotaxis protein